MRAAIHYLPWFIALAACSSPPKAPTVDESMKRPANTQAVVEVQACKNDLHNTRILAAESGRLAESTAATLANVAARQQWLASRPAPSAQPGPIKARPNGIFTVHFDFASTRVVIPAAMTALLIEEAKTAPMVLLRGRTDGTTDAPAESRIARDRATAVRDYLVAAGVDPARVRATYQPAGDHVAHNASAEGRSLNRRVEIELYRALPVPLNGSVAAQP